MAQLTAQGRVKLVFNGAEGGASSALEQKDHPFNNYMMQLTSVLQPHNHHKNSKRRLIRSLDSSTRNYSSSLSSSASSASSSIKNKVKRLNAEARLFVGDETVYGGGNEVGLVDDGSEVVFERDELACFKGLVLDISYRYCSSREKLTIDHVLPIARGGEWKWENLVTACQRCNSKKGQKTVEEANLKLINVPTIPKDYDILAIPLTSAAIKMLKMRKGTPEEWLQYLSKPSSEP